MMRFLPPESASPRFRWGTRLCTPPHPPWSQASGIIDSLPSFLPLAALSRLPSFSSPKLEEVLSSGLDDSSSDSLSSRISESLARIVPS